LSVSNANGTVGLFVSSTSNVGIGTTNPAFPLDIFTDTAGTNSTDTPLRLYSGAFATGSSNTCIRIEKGTGYGGVISGYLTQGVGSGLLFSTLNGGTQTDVMRITNTGNVGIGTTSPGNMFQVGALVGPIYGNNPLSQSTAIILGPSPSKPTYSGTTTLGGTLFVNATDANASNVGASIALGGRGADFGGGQQHMTFARIQGTQAVTSGAYYGNFVIETQNSGILYERMRINQDGYVGIGTTNPSRLLDVRGTSVFGDQLGVGTTTGNQSNVISQFGNGSSALVGGLKIIGTRTATGTDWTTTSLRIQKFVDSSQMGYMEFGAPGGNSDIAFGSSGGTERMRITVGGNVGIGTNNPNATLDVRGSSNILGVINSGPSLFVNGNPNEFGLDSLIKITTSGGSQNNSAPYVNRAFLELQSNTLQGNFNYNMISVTRNAGTLGEAKYAHITGNGSAYFAGNVGIGTVSPEGPFHVMSPNSPGSSLYGKAVFTPGTNGGYGGFLINHMSSYGNQTFINNSDDPFKVIVTGTTCLMVQKANGYVGIGTGSPTNLLSLYATGAAFQASTGGIILQRSDVASSWTISGPDGGNTLRIVNASSVGVQLVNGTTAWAASSDSRLKNIIEPIANAISKTNKLSTVIYSWKTDETNAPHPGLIAQEVLEVQPEAVSEGIDGMLSVRYTELIPLAFAAIKELSSENTALKARLDSIEARLAAAGL
jgi:hypothetical protein